MVKLTEYYLGADLAVDFTPLAVQNIEETGIDWTDDYHALRTHQYTSATLLQDCLFECEGEGEDRATGWREYVWCLCDALGLVPGDDSCD